MKGEPSPVDPKSYMPELDKSVRSIIPPDAHFALLVFADGRCYFQSNAGDEDLARALREMADKIDPAGESKPKRKGRK
jgi:hypothetical protein